MNSEIIIDQSQKFFIIEDDENNIQFKINDIFLNNNINKNNHSSKTNTSILVSQTEIKIKNISNEYICFRVKTTKKKNYIVTPCHHILMPNEIFDIKICFYIYPNEKIDLKGHKFKFEGFIIPKEEKDINAQNLFYEYIKKGNKVKGTIIKKMASFNNIGKVIYNLSNDFNNINNIDNLNKYGEDKKIDEFEDLKIEYCKLKGINENLKIEYFLVKKRMETELKEKKNKSEQFMQLKHDIDIINHDNDNKPLSKNIFILYFIFSILVGFFLMK